jgi:hypothetical protein
MKERVTHKSEPSEITPEGFKNYTENKKQRLKTIVENTETLISRDGKKMSEQDFEALRMLGKGAFGKVVLAKKT